MSSRPLTTPSTFSANGSLFDSFPPLTSNAPLQPLVPYTQAPGHSSSAASQTANSGTFPLLRQHAHPTNTLSGYNFGIYGFQNQPNSAYPQSAVSPISSDHSQVGMLFGYPMSPLSSTGSQTLPMQLSMFREPNFPGIQLAPGGLLYASAGNHGNNASANIINRPSPAMITDPSDPQQNPVLHPYSNQPVMNVGIAGSFKPPNATTVRGSSSFHDPSLFTGQLPESYGGFSTESVPPVHQTITDAGERYEPPPCNNFGLDGATGKNIHVTFSEYLSGIRTYAITDLIDPVRRHNPGSHLRALSI
jgi:hypothetical protein